MKKIYLKPNSNFPYVTTSVEFNTSIEDIKSLLKKFACEEILVHEKGTETKIYLKKGGLPYIIEFPQTYIEGKRTPTKLRMEISGRIVYNEIKALLVGVEIGYLDFMQAMLRYIALPSPEGIISLGDMAMAQKDKISQGAIEFDPQKVKMLKEGAT